MSWKSAVNQPVGSVTIGDIDSFATVHERYGDNKAPIDGFYHHSQQIAKAAADVLHQHAVLGPLLLVGLVSVTENYFREIFALMLNLCPASRKRATEHSVNLGAVLWHDLSRQPKGIFEHMSFASADAVQKQAKNFLNYTIEKNSGVGLVLKEYESICQLRHGAVHAGAELPGRNAVALGLVKKPGVVVIHVGLTQLQQALDICTTLACHFNTSLFTVMAKRWAKEWRRVPGWNAERSDADFETLWASFHSRIDSDRRALSVEMDMISCKSEIEDEYK